MMIMLTTMMKYSLSKKLCFAQRIQCRAKDLPCCLYHGCLCSVMTKCHKYGDKFISCKGSRNVKQTSIRRLRAL